MAPNLARSKHDEALILITSKSQDGALTDKAIAAIIGCSTQTIRNMRANLRCFGTTKAPTNGAGRPKTITPVMLTALCDRLYREPGLYRDEMIEFLRKEFDVEVSRTALSRTLASAGWSKKVSRNVAKERDPDLRAHYIRQIAELGDDPELFVFIDESGCDKLIGRRPTGWAPRGVTPVQINKFHRDKRFQILPAYTQDGIICFRVYEESTDSDIFADFLAEVLCQCGRYPAPRSVLIWDNASWHSSERIDWLCAQAGVKRIPLSPYSPDLNPIEEYFADTKKWITKNWRSHTTLIRHSFKEYLEWCVRSTGMGDKGARAARGHFRNAGIGVDVLREKQSILCRVVN